MSRTQLDLRHLRCPLPVLRTRKALLALDPDDILVVQCTDPLSGIDIPHLIRETGDTLVATVRHDAVLEFTIRKGAQGRRPAPDRPAY